MGAALKIDATSTAAGVDEFDVAGSAHAHTRDRFPVERPD